MFNDSLSYESLPRTLTEASIIFLLKPGKDGRECGSYRPISLLNSDVKILAKALALHLETSMHDVVSVDQTCFILGRHSFTNISKLLNIIHSSASTAVLRWLLHWMWRKLLIFACLRKFGYGPNFIPWIRLLYTLPRASVITNDKQSQYFQLSRGIRQGCPISLLLFALAIESISITLKSLTSKELIEGERSTEYLYMRMIY